MLLRLFLFVFISQITGTSTSSTSTPHLAIYPEVEQKALALGSSFVATCKVSGIIVQNLDTRIRWHAPDGEEIIESAGVGRNIYTLKDPKRPENKLFFNGVRQEDQGTYECSAVVEGNVHTRRIGIVLFKDITFDNAPNPQFKTLHKKELLECRVSGNPVPTVEWLFRGDQITFNMGGEKYSQAVYGLYINNVTREDEGVYICQASVVESGRFEAKEIHLIVEEPPRIDKSMKEFEGVQSYEFTLPCIATGKPEPKFEFFKDDNIHPLHTTDKRHYDAEGGFLTFRPLTEDDHGVYKCKAYSNAGDDTFEMKLDVVVPPSIVSFQNRTGNEHQPYSLSCIVEGKPAPNITMKKASIISFTDPTKEFHMGGNEDGRITVQMVGEKELRVDFKNLKATDYCNYTCLATNKGGVHERNATITVNFKPQFDPANIRSWYIWPGKTKNLTCLSYAEPMPAISWIKYWSIPRAIYDNRTYRVHVMGKNSNLQVTVREEDQNWIYGTYYCVVANQFGSSNLPIELKLAHLPGPPKEVRTKDVSSNTALLEVEPPVDNGGLEILGYRIDFESVVLKFPVGQDIFIEYLRPSTTFVFRVRAYSEVGDGAPLNVYVKTEDVRAPEKLVLTSGEQAGYAYKYTVNWQKPLTGGLPIKEYKFRYRRVELMKVEGLERSFRVLDSGWTEIRKPDEDLDRPVRFYVLNGLKPDTYYEIVVSARNDIGYSEESDPLVFKTDHDPYYIPVEADGNSGLLLRPSFTLLLLAHTFLVCLETLIN